MLDPEILGIDVGSVSVAAALVDHAGSVTRTDYRFHQGRVLETVQALIEEIGPLPLSGLALTSSSPGLFQRAITFDSQVSLVAASRHLYPSVRSILYVGGEKFGLIRFDEAGAYRGARTNSSCAAGTGSFLDQQARRLGLSSAGELARRAGASTAPGPRISTRCAVFARTDLVHAQQAGYSLEEICDGLCRGLAQNITDTLFGGVAPLRPVILAGGVALNDAVRGHLEKILGFPFLFDRHAPALGAIGAALSARGRADAGEPFVLDPGMLLRTSRDGKVYHFPALVSSTAEKPAPAAPILFTTGVFSLRHPVEVETYSHRGPGDVPVRMGIDVGSTSTKAILVDGRNDPVAGFYTRTLGSPLTAVQAICEALEAHEENSGARFRFLGVGTTGAGRKFIGALLKADLVVDEITAHARAAFALDPATDTIIEIGGQDAKFTTMRDGMVTFCHMNTVCAAGTGSFLEEQASRLGCSLGDYERRVQGARSPLSSDRCAVFMERDINTFLSQGFATEEILAAALYSVRENYLTKVARGAGMGKHIAFQGATARNRALVAVFEQGLGKRLIVSPYCHLTGALGAALLVADGRREESRFPGLASLRAEIPVRLETCGLCANHCRLRVATVAGETVAYGFLCGRDYEGARHVERNRSGFDLVKERGKAFSAAHRSRPGSPPPQTTEGPSIGIPAALGSYGHLPLWERFFSLLGVRTVTSEGFDGAIEAGREVQGAEFCAPLAALHGHVKFLKARADRVFLPVLLEESGPHGRQPRHHCYYTEFSAALVSGAFDADLRDRCLMPQVSFTRWRERTRRELFEELRRVGVRAISRQATSRAFEQAAAEYDEALAALKRRFSEETSGATAPCVVLLGRAYNVLSSELGKGIPGILGSLGIKTFFQDMVPYDRRQVDRISGLLDRVHWVSAAKILEVACVVSDTPNLYPVYITSFKCSPDSFAIEYFKRIMDAARKPYLILQLDDHDSTLGYETRIEAGVASFRNHRERTGRDGSASAAGGAAGTPLPVVPHPIMKLGGRTLLFPNWDPLVNPLLTANLRREGVDARLLEEDPFVIRKAMRHNTGQCLPLNIIMQEAVEYVRRHGLDPARTAVWVPASGGPCNIGMFTPFMKSLLEAEGGGMERLEVYQGDFFYQDISVRAAVTSYKAYLAGGLLRRASCRLRPYEIVTGDTDRAVARAMEILVPAFDGARARGPAIREAAAQFDAIGISPARRPRAAIFGDLYVRDNDVMNQGLVRAIEDAGGEALTTPYTEYVRIVAEGYFRKMAHAGNHIDSLRLRALWRAADAIGRSYGAPFARFLEPSYSGDAAGSERFLKAFGLRVEHTGESFENLLKVFHLAKTHPDLALFVQASPAFCCPSMVTEAMARGIERLTGVPVVSITYDGTGQYRNDALVPYLKIARDRHESLA